MKIEDIINVFYKNRNRWMTSIEVFDCFNEEGYNWTKNARGIQGHKNIIARDLSARYKSKFEIDKGSRPQKYRLKYYKFNVRDDLEEANSEISIDICLEDGIKGENNEVYIESNENNSNESVINNIEDINEDELIKSEVKFKKGIKDKSKKASLGSEINRKNRNDRSEDCDNKLSLRKRKYLGWIGEKIIFEHLNNKNTELLSKLSIDINEKYEVEWFNKDINVYDDWIDQSIGNGCDLILRNKMRTIYIEVKTSYKKGYLLTLTGNEIRKASDYRDDYFLIIIDNINSYEKNGIDISIIDDPIKNIVFNNLINNTQSITMYR